MNITLIVAGLASLIVFTGYLAIYNMVGRRQRLDARLGDGDPYASSDSDAYASAAADSALIAPPSPSAAAVETLFSGLGTDMAAYRTQMRLALARAGIGSPDAVAWYLLYRRILGPILALLGCLFLTSEAKGFEYGGMVLTAFLVVTIGIFGAPIYLTNARQKRQKALVRAFPDMLDLLVVCVESGLALDAALNRVTAELGRAYPIVTEELNKTRIELALLNDRGKALQNFAERTDLVAYRSLIAALIQTERFGTSLSDTLRVLSDDYRQQRLMRAEEKAGRLPALLTIPLICFLLPAMFIVILAPPFIAVTAQGGLFGPVEAPSRQTPESASARSR